MVRVADHAPQGLTEPLRVVLFFRVLPGSVPVRRQGFVAQPGNSLQVNPVQGCPRMLCLQPRKLLTGAVPALGKIVRQGGMMLREFVPQFGAGLYTAT